MADLAKIMNRRLKLITSANYMRVGRTIKMIYDEQTTVADVETAHGAMLHLLSCPRLLFFSIADVTFNFLSSTCVTIMLANPS